MIIIAVLDLKNIFSLVPPSLMTWLVLFYLLQTF